MPDHVHPAMSIPPRVAVSDLVGIGIETLGVHQNLCNLGQEDSHFASLPCTAPLARVWQPLFPSMPADLATQLGKSGQKGRFHSHQA
ncbi:MAG: hypothetical protein ACR2OO_12880, partial [Thermomicrobiales bacterium]